MIPNKLYSETFAFESIYYANNQLNKNMKKEKALVVRYLQSFRHNVCLGFVLTCERTLKLGGSLRSFSWQLTSK